MLRIYLLRPNEEIIEKDNPWNPWYDTLGGAVVIAKSNKEARDILFKSDETGDEGATVWLDKKLTVCEELSPNTPGVVLSDFHSA